MKTTKKDKTLWDRVQAIFSKAKTTETEYVKFPRTKNGKIKKA